MMNNLLIYADIPQKLLVVLEFFIETAGADLVVRARTHNVLETRTVRMRCDMCESRFGQYLANLVVGTCSFLVNVRIRDAFILYVRCGDFPFHPRVSDRRSCHTVDCYRGRTSLSDAKMKIPSL